MMQQSYGPDPLGGNSERMPALPVELSSGQWDLAELSVADWRSSLERLKSMAASAAAIARAFGPQSSAADAGAFLEQFNGLCAAWERVEGFFELRLLADSADSEAQAAQRMFNNAWAEYLADFKAFDRWLGGLSPEQAAQVITGCGSFAHYARRCREAASHLLSDDEERIIAFKDPNGIDALGAVYDALTTQYKFLWKGQEVVESTLLAGRESPDAQDREASFRAQIERYARDRDALGIIYSAIVNNWRLEHVERRRYASALDVQAAEAEIPREVIASFLSVSSDNVPVIQEYLDLKRRALGLERMTRFDVYARLACSQEGITYEDAAALVLEAFGGFSAEAGRALEDVFRAKHAHSRPQEGKYAGAMCIQIADLAVPYLLLNFEGRLSDLIDLGHESGHAVHFRLAACQPALEREASVVVCETASILGEELVTREVMRRYPQQRAALLDMLLTNTWMNLTRQVDFTRFEILAHDLVAQGASVEDLSEAYLKIIREQFGSNIEVHDLFKDEWLFVSHMFASPFYCYSYGMGKILSLAVYSRWMEEGESFAQRYVDSLRAGGSLTPENLFEGLGLDLKSRSTWQRGWDQIAALVNDFRVCLGDLEPGCGRERFARALEKSD